MLGCFVNFQNNFPRVVVLLLFASAITIFIAREGNILTILSPESLIMGRWDPFGKEAAILFDLFGWGIGPYDSKNSKNFKNETVYNEPKHHHIWRHWTKRAFFTNITKLLAKFNTYTRFKTGKQATMELGHACEK